MAFARGAEHLGPAHEEAPVLLGLERVLARRLVERGPAAAGVVLRVRAEELRTAAGTPVDARLEHVVVLAAPWPLRSLLPEDAELLRRQVAPPLRLRLPHLCRHVVPFVSVPPCSLAKSASVSARRRPPSRSVPARRRPARAAARLSSPRLPPRRLRPRRSRGGRARSRPFRRRLPRPPGRRRRRSRPAAT